MARRCVYFELDFYGVGFYEEEITTGGKRRASAARGPARVLFELEDEDPPDLSGGHHYDYDDDDDDYDDDDDDYSSDVDDQGQSSQQKPEQVQLQDPANTAGVVAQQQPRSRRNQHKFTPGQLHELLSVFQETPYPDSLKKRELAELFNVDERTVRYWFNNKRAKDKKDRERH